MCEKMNYDQMATFINVFNIVMEWSWKMEANYMTHDACHILISIIICECHTLIPRKWEQTKGSNPHI
jgi:hypothetical protein